MTDQAFQQLLLSEMRHIREQLEKTNDLITEHREDHFKLKQEVHGLKLKSGILGALSGALTSIAHKILT